MPYCANCGGQVAEGAAVCPSCGHPQGAVHASAPTAYATKRTDGNAIASLVLGIVGLVMCPLIPSVIAIILGNQSKARIAMDPNLEGEGMAKAGVIMGWIGVGLVAVAAVFWVVIAVLAIGSGSGDFNF